jgi:bis(5'-nucleosyl)-tetraphosphatase (symmetrical)
MGKSAPLALVEQDVLVVHAGVPPDWSLEQTLARAGEVEAWLQGPDVREFLRDAYGDSPARFDETQSGTTRARTITNALTRLRFCAADGRMNFDAKGSTSTGPKDMLPWFAHPNRALGDTRIAFGHWALLYGKVNVKNVLALDTACVWGYELTMLRLDDGVKLSCGC